MAFYRIYELKPHLQAFFAKASKFPLKSIIYAEQGTPLVLPCIVYKIRSHRTLGAPALKKQLGNLASHTTRPNWKDIIYHYEQAVEVIVSINAFGEGAQEVVMAIAASRFRQNLQVELRRHDIGFFNASSPRDLTALTQSRYQQRFQIDAHFAAKLKYTEKVEQMHSVKYAVRNQEHTVIGDTNNHEHSH